MRGMEGAHLTQRPQLARQRLHVQGRARAHPAQSILVKVARCPLPHERHVALLGALHLRRTVRFSLQACAARTAFLSM